MGGGAIFSLCQLYPDRHVLKKVPSIKSVELPIDVIYVQISKTLCKKSFKDC